MYSMYCLYMMQLYGEIVHFTEIYLHWEGGLCLKSIQWSYMFDRPSYHQE